MDVEFDSLLLTTYKIKRSDYEEFIDEIRREVERFREDLKKLKEDPFLEEKEFFPEDVQGLANKLVEFKKREEVLEKWKAEREVLEHKLVDALTEQGLKKCNGFDGWTFSVTKNGNIRATHKESE